MSDKKEVDKKEVDKILEFCGIAEETGSTEFPDFTYEEGVKAGIEWALGHTDQNPINYGE